MKRWALIASILLAGMCRTGVAADASKSGMDPTRLAQIPLRMKALVDDRKVAGVVTLVYRHGEIAEFDAVGWQDLEKQRPMKKDSIFQIMSMTKPVTAVGIMMLMEEGKLSLLDPVEKHLPEFRGQKVVAGRDADGTITLKKPSRPITIRDLLTHTSGMPGGAPEGIQELEQKMDLTLADAVRIYSQQPLAFEPGAKWQYSNTGIATLGRIIEVASGQKYEDFIGDRLLKPLEMNDSFFFPPADKIARIALVYRREEGKLVPVGGKILGGDPAHYRKGARYPAPEWGLYSTAGDLLSLYRMMLNKGTLNGRRYLSPPSVEVMTEPHTADIPKSSWLSGAAYGLAWEVVKDPLGTLLLNSIGTYGHGGAFGTQGWIDPKRDLIRILMVQGGETDDARNAFMGMAASAIVE